MRNIKAALLCAFLGGCIPPAPRVAVDEPAPSAGPSSPDARPQLSLDLANLKEPPAWEPRPVAARAVVENGMRVHVVGPGETGIAIARAYGVRWSDIVTVNGLTEPSVLRVGQRLRLPGSDTAPSIEARAAAFRIGIDDLVSGAAPAQSAAVAAPIVRGTLSTDTTSRFVWPAAGPVVGRFGSQGGGRVNQGIDIAAAATSPVRAAAPGTVAFVGRGVPNFGGVILIAHPGNWVSAYGRIGNFRVAKGDTVRAGDVIGSLGSDGPLHFQLRRARTPVDPLKQLPRR